MYDTLAATRSGGRIHRLLLAMAMLIVFMAAPAIAQSDASGDSSATPATQALKIYKALASRDFKAMFSLIAFTEKGRTALTTAEAFDAEMRSGYESSFKTPQERADTEAILSGISDIMVGEAVVSGNTAVVPTSCNITYNGQTLAFRGEAHLILDRGVWKLDLTFDEDSEKTMAQRTTELIGSPEAK